MKRTMFYEYVAWVLFIFMSDIFVSTGGIRKLLIQGHPRSGKVTHIADFKSAYISLIIGPRGLQCETNL